MIRRLAKNIFPAGSRRHGILKRRIEPLLSRAVRAPSSARADLSYADWIAEVEPATISPVEQYKYRPLISIVVPAYNTPDKYLSPMLDSVIAQTYDNWELVLVEGSPDPERAEAIHAASKRDKRIRLIKLGENLGIALNTNEGIKQAEGDYIAFMDHDDTLAPFALNEVVQVLQDRPAVDVFYSDEDKLTEDGRSRLNPLFKPDWSRDMFLGVNYLAHFVVVRASLVRAVKGVHSGFDGAQDFDFLLRLLPHNPEIYHVQHVSYHWRQAIGSTGASVNEKSYASEAGLRALQGYISRHEISAEAIPVVGRPTEYRLKYRVSGAPTVYVVPVHEALPTWIERIIADTSYRRLKFIHDESEVHNASDLLLKLDVSARPTDADWLAELIGIAQQPNIAWVGGCMVNGPLCQGVGLAWDQGIWSTPFEGLELTRWTHMGTAAWPRNLLAANPNCAIIEVGKLQKLSSADPIKGGLEAHILRFRNVYWPYARFQSDQRLEDTGDGGGFALLRDPFLNPNLHIRSGDFTL